MFLNQQDTSLEKKKKKKKEENILFSKFSKTNSYIKETIYENS